MVRTFIGGLVGGVIHVRHRLHLLGDAARRDPLFAAPTTPQSAAVQLALNAEPDPDRHRRLHHPRATRRAAGRDRSTRRGRSRPSISTPTGFATEDMSMLLPGFIIALVAGLLMAFGLAAVGGGGRSFAGTARLVVLFSLGFCVWEYLADADLQPFRLALLDLRLRRRERVADPRRAGDRALVPAAGRRRRRRAGRGADRRPRARRGSGRRRRSRARRRGERRGGFRILAPLLGLPLLVERRRGPGRRRGRSRLRPAPARSSSEPEMVTSGDRPASANGSRAATAAPSRATVSGGCGMWITPAASSNTTS